MDHRDRHQGRHQDADLHQAHQHQAHQHQDVDHQNQGEGHQGRHQDADHQGRHQDADHQDLDVCLGRDEYQDRDDCLGQDVLQDRDGSRRVRQDGTLEQFVDQVEVEWVDQKTTLGQEVAELVDHQDAHQAAFQEESPLDDLVAEPDVTLVAD